MSAIVTPKRLYADAVPVVQADVIDAGTLAVIHNIELCNTTAAAITVTMFHYVSSYLQCRKISVAPYDTVQIAFSGVGVVLEATDKLAAVADAEGVNLFIYGSHITV
jgi:hypothetical protein